MSSISQPERSITPEQAAEFINRSNAGQLVGRMIGKGPFKGMSREEALKLAIGVVNQNRKSSAKTKELLKAISKIKELSPATRLEAGKTAKAYERNVTSTNTTDNPLDDHLLLESLSDQLGIDLFHLKEVITTKYPKLLDGMKQLVNSYSSRTDNLTQNLDKRSISYDLIALERALCRTGDLDLKIKSPVELFLSSKLKVATSAINLFVNVPLGVGRVVASPFIAIAGGIMTLAGHDKGQAVLKSAAAEAALGSYGALSATIGFVGSVLAAVIDPLVGKEVVREAQLKLRGKLSQAIVHTTVGAVNKFKSTPLKYQIVLRNISRMTLPESGLLTSKKIPPGIRPATVKKLTGT